MLSYDEQAIIAAFHDNYELYEQLEQRAMTVINRIIDENNFFVMQVSHRIKNVDSLMGKLRQKSGKYKSLYDITDIFGVRIICFFSDTVDKIAEKIEEVFDVDVDNSIDKRVSLQATQFGYLSLHYVCSLKGDDAVSNIGFEIQLRTVLQHAWAEIEHDLGYKSEFGVPRPIRREFSRVASLLEIADNQFISLRESTHAYTEEVRAKIINGETSDVQLDKVSLFEYVRINDAFCNLCKELTNKTGVEIEVIEPDIYISQFEWLGLTSIGDLDEFLRRNVDRTLVVIADKIKEYELDLISTNMILRYLCYVELSNDKYNEQQLKEFLVLSGVRSVLVEGQIEEIKELGKLE